MKLQTISLYIILCTHLALSATPVPTVSHSVKEEDKQASDSTPSSIKHSINTNASGFSNFLKYSYNQPEYAQTFLPNNFNHLLELCEYGEKSKQSRAYAQSLFRLFANKLKGSSYVHVTAFTDLLERLPRLLNRHFALQRSNIQVVQEKINNVLYARFLEKFSDFKKDPHVFFTDLSLEIVDALGASTDIGDISMEELRKTVIVFLEVAVGKLIWSPEDHIDTWKSVKQVSEHLARLTDTNVIADVDDLNDIFTTLIERYCFFIDLAGDHLPATFYRDIKQDIAKSPCMLLKLAEQEPLIETKAQRLHRVVCQNEEKHKKSYATAAL